MLPPASFLGWILLLVLCALLYSPDCLNESACMDNYLGSTSLVVSPQHGTTFLQSFLLKPAMLAFDNHCMLRLARVCHYCFRLLFVAASDKAMPVRSIKGK